MAATPWIGSQQSAFTPRHIYVITETYLPEVNGVAFTLAHLVDGLLARGHAVSVVRPRRQTSDRPDYGCRPKVALVPGLPFPWYKGLQIGLPAGGLLQRCWRRHRPDVVYVATQGPLGWSAVRTARLLGVPVFSGFHTNFHSYSKYYGGGWLRPVIVGYLRHFHNRTLGTLVPSVDLCDRLHTIGFKNVHVLDRGVDSQLFTPERRCPELRYRWGVPETGLAVLYVGRVAPEKNLRVAVAAYRAMQGFSDALKFVIVGDGPFRATLQKESPDLIFCGVRTGEDLARHYASADVFLFPSETETFGNVTLEAMASGLVVVAYDYAAARMHITNGETGMLVPCGESQAFIDAAANLARAPQSLPKMRWQARAYARAINWPHVVEKFETLLTSALARSHTAPSALITRRGVAI
jgi:glycosyltransferase involved in cell wall biosynthesis